MAPEVFTKNMNEGHGRAADIWSVGCVVIEMASAKVSLISLTTVLDYSIFYIEQFLSKRD